MANEIYYDLGETGRTVYAVVRSAAGEAWNGSAFATYTTTRGDFDLAMSEIGTTGSYGPINLPGTGDGRWWQIYVQAGASPDHTNDTRIVTGYHTIGSVAGHTPQTGDNFTRLGAPTGASHAADNAAIKTAVDTVDDVVDSILVDTAEIGAAGAGLTALATQASVNTIDSNVDGIKNKTDLIQLFENPADGDEWYVLTRPHSLDANAQAEVSQAVWITDHVDYAGGTDSMGGQMHAYLDASIGSRASQTSVDTVDENIDTVVSRLPDTLSLANINSQVDTAIADVGLTTTVTGRIDAAVSSVSGGGGITIPVNQVPVPIDRTWILKATANGLFGELPLIRVVGEEQLFAIDFRHDLPNNGRLISLDAISVVSGTEGGVLIDEEDQGVDRSQAKLKLSLVTAGTYIITAQVTYDDSDGGGTSEGSVTLIVRPSLLP
jgi:hypothetical protein